MIKTKEQIKEQVKEILDDNYCKFQGGGEADTHSCYDIAELFEQQFLEKEKEIKRYRNALESIREPFSDSFITRISSTED